MKLANAPAAYDPKDQALVRGAIERADRMNLKSNVAAEFILLKQPNGTVGRLAVDNTGALTFTPL